MMTLIKVTVTLSNNFVNKSKALAMSHYPNIPQGQQHSQRLIDQFSQDEALWRSLAPHRRMRRKMLRRLGKKRHRVLDLLEFAALRPSDDCVGVRLDK